MNTNLTKKNVRSGAAKQAPVNYSILVYWDNRKVKSSTEELFNMPETIPE